MKIPTDLSRFSPETVGRSIFRRSDTWSLDHQAVGRSDFRRSDTWSLDPHRDAQTHFSREFIRKISIYIARLTETTRNRNVSKSVLQIGLANQSKDAGDDE
jgi:hypothetical protein